jgi:glucan 1,4-alpha-glucosidase
VKEIFKNICFGFFAALILPAAIFAQTLAPGSPGNDAQWASAGKQGIGTSASTQSKVWFTLQGGALTEVYYPDVTMANVHVLQFFVFNPKLAGNDRIETERDDTYHKVEPVKGSLSFKQVNHSKHRQWSIEKTYVTDSQSNSLLVKINFVSADPADELYVYYDPSLANSGMHDTGWSEGNAFLSGDGDISSALTCARCKFTEMTNGFLGTSDGLTQLRKEGKIAQNYSRAENGNIVQVARLMNLSRDKDLGEFELALSFGKTSAEAFKTAQDSLVKGFAKCQAEYDQGWADYVKKLPVVDEKYQAQFNMAAMVLKAHEDKSHPGANIASLTVPWGGGANANENNIGGYHLVWSRDLYQVATAYMALGDKAAAARALEFLFKVQQKPDGSFPQNSWLDGKPFWGSLQLDEVAYPIILAYQLGVFDGDTYRKHVKPAADFILKNGPKTPQERWEEESGYSPSTIAAEIAGLVCAAHLAEVNNDEASAIIYRAAADDWARNVEQWTATTTGKYGDGNYYLRLTQNGEPDKGDKIELNNGAGVFDEREIVDAGFLELVRLGIKPANDPLIEKSLKIIDENIRVRTPNGDAFYRYNHDGYGEMEDGRRWNWDGKYTGKGRLWTLLSGERGEYELAKCSEPQASAKDNKCPSLAAAGSRLDTMLDFANEGLMIPEQVWDKKEIPIADSQFSPDLRFGEGTGSATPLAWSMAQFVRLAANLKAGKDLETPAVVFDRYAGSRIPPHASNFGGMDQEVILPPMPPGQIMKFPREASPGTKVAYELNGETGMAVADEKGQVILELKMPAQDTVGLLGVQTPGGATAFERVIVRVKPREQQFSQTLIDKIRKAKQSPVIENGKATLFYRGPAKQVFVAGDMTSWNPGRVVMQEIDNGLKAVQLELGSAARAEYKFVADDKWMLDDLNPQKMDNGVGGENSIITMPGYKAADIRETNVSPEIQTKEIESKVLGDKRQIRIYLPPSAQGSKTGFSVLYFQDGSDYIKRAKAIEIQRQLVAEGKLKPFIMVFIDYKDRTKEYWANDRYAEFLIREVVPVVDQYHTIPTREGRGILGASLGGITSFWTALKYPEIFSRVGGQSSSFWIDDERVVSELAKLDQHKTKFRFYIDDGVLEGVDDSRRVNVMLRGKGFPVVYREGDSGHNWTSWRDRLAEAFIALMKD